MESERFEILDVLRGFLSWWVVFGHVMEFSALDGYLPHWAWARSAVQVFIIMSGFVITHLLTVKHEPYACFITRRFFRIWPVMAICMLTAVVINPSMIHAVGWHAREVCVDEVHSWAMTTSHPLWAYLVSSLTMLQGATSEVLLPGAGHSFLPPAWSISLEWQFYLIAPLLLLGRKYLLWVAFGVMVLTHVGDSMMFVHFPTRCFIGQEMPYFLIGIVSCLALKEKRINIFLLPLAFIIPGIESVPVAIWIAALAFIHLEIKLPILLYLGAISFPVYLSHYLILRLMKIWVLAVDDQMPRVMMAVLLAMGAIPLTLLVASALHFGIERPGMALGKIVARRIGEIDWWPITNEGETTND